MSRWEALKSIREVATVWFAPYVLFAFFPFATTGLDGALRVLVGALPLLFGEDSSGAWVRFLILFVPFMGFCTLVACLMGYLKQGVLRKMLLLVCFAVSCVWHFHGFGVWVVGLGV